MKYVICSFMVLFIVGCAGSPYTYYSDPTPIVKGKTKYTVGKLVVNLTLGHGAIEDDSAFATEDKLERQFLETIEKELKARDIFFTKNSGKGMEVNIHIDYTRKFNYGGKSLNKPEVSDKIEVFEGDNKLASFGKNNYTTKYSYLKEIAVGAEIAAFKWGADDEVQDIKAIGKTIVDDLYNLGR